MSIIDLKILRQTNEQNPIEIPVYPYFFHVRQALTKKTIYSIFMIDLIKNKFIGFINNKHTQTRVTFTLLCSFCLQYDKQTNKKNHKTHGTN